MHRSKVIVIGGGPSGCTAALTLLKHGIEVTIIEKSEFPRFHLGESMLAMSNPYLEYLNLYDVIDNHNFLKKTGSLFVWDEFHKNLGMPHPKNSWQVERAKLDELLLKEVQLRGGTHIKDRIIRIEDEKPVRLKGKKGEYLCDFLIDASGNNKVATNKLKKTYTHYGNNKVALFSQVKNSRRLAGNQYSHIITEKIGNGWMWFIPLTKYGITSVGTVQNREDLKEFNIDYYIDKSKEIKNLMPKNIKFNFKNRRMYYSSYLSDTPIIGSRIYLVGDALMFVDPLFSTGIHSGMQAAVKAGLTISYIIENNLTDEESSEFRNLYCEDMNEYYQRTYTMIQTVYGLSDGQAHINEKDLINMKKSGLQFFIDIGAYKNKTISKPFEKVELTSNLKLSNDAKILYKFFYNNFSLQKGLEIKSPFSDNIKVPEISGSYSLIDNIRKNDRCSLSDIKTKKDLALVKHLLSERILTYA